MTLVASAALALVGQLTTKAAVLYDSLGFTYNNGADISSTAVWHAQSFDSGSQSQLTDVTLNLYKDSAGSGTYFVELRNSVAHGETTSPGNTVVYTFTSSGNIAGLGTANDGTLGFTGLSVSLSADTEYFIVVGCSAVSAGKLIWGQSAATGQPSLNDISTDTGSSWLGGFDGETLRMQVEAVPEPVNVAMAVFGFGAALAAIGRRIRLRTRS